MKIQKLLVCFSALLMAQLLISSELSAQGLLWSLPEDGQWVRYEGDYLETDKRPEAAEGDLKIHWDRHVIIKSVGKENTQFEGQEVPCRWIEFKSLTGHTIEGAIDPGPAGEVIYKVLVPESAVNGKNSNPFGLPLAFVPIVKGYRKIGDKAVTKIGAGVLQLYPMITLLQQYPNLKETGEEDLDLPLGATTAKKWTGSHKMEREESRSQNAATFWRSSDVPFGLAAWKVKIERESKEASSPRSEFEPKSEIEVDMKAAEIGDNAQSEIVNPE